LKLLEGFARDCIRVKVNFGLPVMALPPAEHSRNWLATEAENSVAAVQKVTGAILTMSVLLACRFWIFC